MATSMKRKNGGAQRATAEAAYQVRVQYKLYIPYCLKFLMPTSRSSRAKATSAKSVTVANVVKPAQRARPDRKGAHAAKAQRVADKLVRDSFTIPKSEYAALASLKTRAVELKRPAKKSELLRAGIFVLERMKDRAFLAALNSVPSLKTGRPKAAPADAQGARSGTTASD